MAAWTSFDLFKQNQLKGATKLDFDDGNFYIAFTASDVVTNRATWDFFNDITEITGGEVAAWGFNLAAADVDVSSNAARFIDATTVISFVANVSNPTTAKYAVLYHKSGTDATASRLVAYAVLNAGSTVDMRDGYTLTTTSGVYFSW